MISLSPNFIDLRRFGVQVAPAALRRFWSMGAHYHGQIWNASKIGRSLGEAHTAVKRHLDILCGASWEGFALEEGLRMAGDREAYLPDRPAC